MGGKQRNNRAQGICKEQARSRERKERDEGGEGEEEGSEGWDGCLERRLVFMRRGAPERINGLWCLISWRTINLPTVLSWLKVKCWNRSMRTAASEIAAAPSAGRGILISSSSFSPAATLDEAVPDMAERAATSQQARRTLSCTPARTLSLSLPRSRTHRGERADTLKYRESKDSQRTNTALWCKHSRRRAKISAEMNPILYTFSSITDDAPRVR